MRNIRIRTEVLAAIIALLGIWIAVPASADAHSMTGAAGLDAGHFGHRTGHLPSVRPALVAVVDCGDDLGSTQPDGCCGASPFGCCGPCLVLPTEPAAAAPSDRPVFASVLARGAAGLPPDRLKRPPRARH